MAEAAIGIKETPESLEGYNIEAIVVSKTVVLTETALVTENRCQVCQQNIVIVLVSAAPNSKPAAFLELYMLHPLGQAQRFKFLDVVFS